MPKIIETCEKIRSRVELVPGIILFGNALADIDDISKAIATEIQLEQRFFIGNGERIPFPRKSVTYGDKDTSYQQCGSLTKPKPWTPALAALRDRLNARLHTQVNACTINAYVNGNHSIGWHSDDQPEIVDRIIVVSLGQTRTLLLREHSNEATQTATPLETGSILTMTIASQTTHEHCSPREPADHARLELTFRTIKTQPNHQEDV